MPHLALVLRLCGAVSISGGGRRVACRVPCFWPPQQMWSVVTEVSIDGSPVRALMSMESEAYYPQLRLDSRHTHRLIASTRLDSDVPMPYFSWAEYNIQRPAPPFRETHKSALFVARNCNSKSGREKLVTELMKHMPVVSASSCLNNFAWPDHHDKAKLMRQHTLYLAFENSVIDDYITEKLWGAYAAGVIPVYYGAPNILNRVPPNSLVVAASFATTELLARHLKSILRSAALYNAYHAWRYRPLPAAFVALYNFTHVHSECRLCILAESLHL